MNTIKQIAFVLLMALITNSCHNIFVDSELKNTPRENFNSIWKSVDERYCYFEEKGVNWLEIKEKYSRQIYDEMSDEELFAVCAQMIGELKDGHVNLVAPFDMSRYWDWYLDFPPNFNYAIIERNYLTKNFVSTSGASASILDAEDRNIGYIYYGSFEYELSDKSAEALAKKFANCNGIILDIRDNGGGAVKYMYQLASYFTKQEIAVGYTRYKKGKGHNDFTDYFPEKVIPSKSVFFDKKIVLLTNRQTYSAANIFPGMMKYFPNVTIIGDSTGGGGASPLSMDMPNGWCVRISSISFVNMDKNTFEFGVAPDIYAETTFDDAKAGKDAIIERAMDFLTGRY